ncbi:hypothetical protein Y1Q_0023090 [Alligator mississippiensis]|uniref:Uncharacterized protein n=1 Tax=Alligator mississippiensis TaxID=8496 RepID=A0A151NJV4_ALLMI|nr:hypothetical protein Y1Q_0023090 [Alligator mississippiensis]
MQRDRWQLRCLFQLEASAWPALCFPESAYLTRWFLSRLLAHTEMRLDQLKQPGQVISGEREHVALPLEMLHQTVSPQDEECGSGAVTLWPLPS